MTTPSPSSPRLVEAFLFLIAAALFTSTSLTLTSSSALAESSPPDPSLPDPSPPDPLALQPLSPLAWVGFWQDSPVVGGGPTGHFVLFSSGRFFSPFYSARCANADTLPYDFAGSWTPTPEGVRLFIEVEHILKRVTCACDDDFGAYCEVSFEQDMIARPASPDDRKVIDVRFVGYFDGDQLQPTPSPNPDDYHHPAAERLGETFYKVAIAGANQTPADYFADDVGIGNRPTIHPDLLAYFQCALTHDKLTCAPPP